mmetsp:Transcript_11161/g.32388  ORF Transcript_11161/g.32388 Transcript_11161/m.32388 type:complete len:209 (+) Transcript_11161:487-1113(+)
MYLSSWRSKDERIARETPPHPHAARNVQPKHSSIHLNPSRPHGRKQPKPLLPSAGQCVCCKGGKHNDPRQTRWPDKSPDEMGWGRETDRETLARNAETYPVSLATCSPWCIRPCAARAAAAAAGAARRWCGRSGGPLWCGSRGTGRPPVYNPFHTHIGQRRSPLRSTCPCPSPCCQDTPAGRPCARTARTSRPSGRCPAGKTHTWPPS